MSIQFCRDQTSDFLHELIPVEYLVWKEHRDVIWTKASKFWDHAPLSVQTFEQISYC